MTTAQGAEPLYRLWLGNERAAANLPPHPAGAAAFPDDLPAAPCAEVVRPTRGCSPFLRRAYAASVWQIGRDAGGLKSLAWGCWRWLEGLQ